MLDNAHDGPGVRIDTHVHLHPDFDLSKALDAATQNMNLATSGRPGMLMLTEMPGINRFAELGGSIEQWEISPTTEATSVVATSPTGVIIAIVAGHQVVTEEGIEVLMLGSLEPVPSGNSLNATIHDVVEANALAVLPWGVGKWSGSRGQKIAELANQPAPGKSIFLADTGVRPSFLARPKVLKTAEDNGWRVLAGTDPLPLNGQDKTVGRYGIDLMSPLDTSRPFHSVKDQMTSLTESPKTYGQLQPSLGFFALQFGMQVRKRMK